MLSSDRRTSNRQASPAGCERLDLLDFRRDELAKHRMDDRADLRGAPTHVRRTGNCARAITNVLPSRSTSASTPMLAQMVDEDADPFLAAQLPTCGRRSFRPSGGPCARRSRATARIAADLAHFAQHGIQQYGRRLRKVALAGSGQRDTRASAWSCCAVPALADQAVALAGSARCWRIALGESRTPAPGRAAEAECGRRSASTILPRVRVEEPIVHLLSQLW